MNSQNGSDKAIRKSFWIVFGFYFIICFEFFYMVSPFALYFYSVYEPGLVFISHVPFLSFLSTVFLPHIVSQTASPLLNVLHGIGIFLIFAGLLVFVIGAGQVYYYKLRRKEVVTKGVYRFIRHPQYAALTICGFGLLILWPRYLALLSYISMLFFYYFLAKVEEKECIRKFGDSYTNYLNQTSGILPFRIPVVKNRSILPSNRILKVIFIIGIYVSSCFVGIFIADKLRDWSLDQLYALYEKDSVTISITRLEKDELESILSSVRNHPEAANRLSNQKQPLKTINYIMPVDWSASEIPMNPVPGTVYHHNYPDDKPIDRFRIVLTEAIPVNENQTGFGGKDILFNTAARIPIFEVVMDRNNRKVIKIIEPATNYQLKGIPLPLY